MNMVVLQFPPRESCRMRVILLSRYGTWVFYREQGPKSYGLGRCDGGMCAVVEETSSPLTRDTQTSDR